MYLNVGEAFLGGRLKFSDPVLALDSLNFFRWLVAAVECKSFPLRRHHNLEPT